MERSFASSRARARVAAIIALFIGLLLVSRISQASNQCVAQCETTSNTCLAAKAAGCQLAGKGAQAAVESLASQSPLGGLLAGAAGELASQACNEAIQVCGAIRTTCLAECGVSIDPNGTVTVVTAPAIRSTLRVFSSVSRSIVYINGERMGATPADSLEPFVTPELTVGKYWIRVISNDGTLDWEGEKDIVEGNVNSVEAQLSNDDDRAWRECGPRPDPLQEWALLQGYLTRFPSGAHVQEASKRVEDLSVKIDALEDGYIAAVESAASADDFLPAARDYRDIYGFEGRHRARFEAALAAYKSELDAVKSVLPEFNPAFDEVWSQARRSHELRMLRVNFPELRYYAERVRELEFQVRRVEWEDPPAGTTPSNPYQSAKSLVTLGSVFTGFGLAGIAAGGAVLGIGIGDGSGDSEGALVGGGSGLAMGGVFTVLGLIFAVGGSQKLKELKRKSSVSVLPALGPSSAGLTVVGRF